MSTRLPDTPNLGLLSASLTQALWHALAFRRAASVRALGAPRAHVLHAHAPSRRVSLPPTSRPFWPLANRSQRAPSSPTPQSHPDHLWHPTTLPSGRPWWLADGRSRPRPWQHRPSHSSAPAALWNSSSSSASSSASARRRHVALQLQHGCRRRSYPLPPREPASSAI